MDEMHLLASVPGAGRSRRDRSQAVILTALALAAVAAARADIRALDPLARPSTRIGPGCLLALNVSIHAIDEPELCGQVPVGRDGTVELTVGFRPIDPIPVAGLTAAEAAKRIQAAIRRFYAAEPDVRVGIARIPRFQVVVEGATFRAGVVTLPEGARLSDLLAETGYQSAADLSQVRIARVEPGGARSALTANFARVLDGSVPADDPVHDPVLRNGDKITLTLSPVPAIPQTIAVLGEVGRPGIIPFKPGMTVRDALQEAFGLTPAADPERVVIRRLKDGSITTVSAAKALENVPTENLKLVPDDTVIVNTRDSGRRFAVLGSVASPRTFDYKQPVTLTEAITDAGGFKPEADRRRVVIVKNMLSDPTRSETVTVNYDEIAARRRPDLTLQPGDLVQISPRKKSGFNLLDLGGLLLRFFVF